LKTDEGTSPLAEQQKSEHFLEMQSRISEYLMLKAFVDIFHFPLYSNRIRHNLFGFHRLLNCPLNLGKFSGLFKCPE